MTRTRRVCREVTVVGAGMDEAEGVTQASNGAGTDSNLSIKASPRLRLAFPPMAVILPRSRDSNRTCRYACNVGISDRQTTAEFAPFTLERAPLRSQGVSRLFRIPKIRHLRLRSAMPGNREAGELLRELTRSARNRQAHLKRRSMAVLEVNSCLANASCTLPSTYLN